jgi:hypothetical protein
VPLDALDRSLDEFSGMTFFFGKPMAVWFEYSAMPMPSLPRAGEGYPGGCFVIASSCGADTSGEARRSRRTDNRSQQFSFPASAGGFSDHQIVRSGL